jgi:threonine dehydrogenase-like Zn-dependent dehydrogenase
MKALLFEGHGSFAISALPDPVPGPGEALVATRACGVCHTDIDILHGRYGASAFPLVPGHEYAGVVEAVGEGVTRVEPGDRVAVDPNISCGTCRACRNGLFNLCQNLRAYGVTSNGGFAELSVVAEENLHPVGDMPFEVAALAEPLGCVLTGLGAVGTAGVANALVFGAGPIGLLMGLALKDRGLASVAMADVDESRLAFAEALHLTPVKAGTEDLAPFREATDLVADCTGVPAVAESLLGYAANGGAALVFGVCPPGAHIAVEPFQVFRRQLRLLGTHSLNHNIPEALAMLARSGEAMARVISHRLDLDEVAAGLGHGGPGRLKVQYAVH